MPIIFMYLLTGATAGLFSGMLGIGGGLVTVPLLSAIFAARGIIPEDMIMHVTLATSLSGILFTSVSSARSHARRGAVVWCFVRGVAPFLAAGTALGSRAAASLPSFGLKVFFVVFLFATATQMLLDFYPPAREAMPGRAVLAAAGTLIGGVSSMAGLGGGSMSVPFLRWCGVDMRRAVGTSAALGGAIAAVGAVGFAAAGWNAPGLPPYSLGYVNVPATLGVACASIFFAPLGVRLSNAMPVSVLRKVFAVFLYVVASRMLWGVIA
jgi:uncharacterized membrane protein YfcA